MSKFLTFLRSLERPNNSATLESISTGYNTIFRRDVKNLPTDDLEKHIENRYKSGARQKELDFLETQYAERVSEESPGFLDELEDDKIPGGAGLEEELERMYHEYINDIYPFSYLDEDESKSEVAGNIRSVVDSFKGGKTDKLSDEELIEIAKDSYERKLELRKRYKSNIFESF